MINLLRKILFDEQGALVTPSFSFSPNTLISSSQVNTVITELKDGINAVDTTQISANAITKALLNSDVVRTGYGLSQHTDYSLQVDVSDTNPCLEIADGGVRAKVYGLINRTSDGLTWGRSGDMLLSSSATTPDGFSDVSSTYANKFIRISATALSAGGSDSHTHGIGTYATAADGSHYHKATSDSVSDNPMFNDYAASGYYTSTATAHTHTLSGSSASADNIPAYITLKMYQKN